MDILTQPTVIFKLSSPAAVAAELAGQYPALATQLEQGAVLVEAGDVRIYPQYITVTKAPGQGEYLVRFSDMVGYACQCREWQDGREARFHPRNDAAPTVKPFGTVCRHVAAVIVATELRLIPAGTL